MPLENSLNVNPYFDDFSQNRDYYKILFKPGVSVQTRELNQLQTMLQNQIEKFGDHIFKSGTILSGINFSYQSNYPYIKIADVQTDGEPVVLSAYLNYFIKSDNNLNARVVNYVDGIESKAPDLNTLYLQYVSSSDPDVANSGAIYTTFTPGQTLTVYSQHYPLFDVLVNNGGLGFSNSDTVVVTSSIIVSGNTVAFSNGEILTQSTTGAQVQIASINTTAVANTTIIKVKPRSVDLTNTSVNSTSWSLSEGYTVAGNTSGATANVTSLIGSGATALLLTDTQGIVQTVTLQSSGQDYTYLPTLTIKTSNTTATLNNLDIVPLNYKAKVTVANASVNAVGSGYAFTVSEGVIYQKGYFLSTQAQTVVVSKYDSYPDSVAVGFVTTEDNITAFADESLYDNASNTTNYAAPGADRLQLTPVLTVANTADINDTSEFLTLAEWKGGVPFKENKTTVYSNIGDEMARRTREAQGNFVIDPFLLGAREKATPNTQYGEVIVDPGTGYINGYRISSDYNTYIDVPKATTTAIETNKTITVNYGNYVIVKELAGFFNFKAGATVSLRDTAKSYVSTATIGSSPAITAAGSEIGTARMRSLVVNGGEPGTSGCTYRLYLFDVQMNAGYSFRAVRSVYFDSTEDGVADVVTEYDATTASQVAVFYDSPADKMLFNVGATAVKALTNINYSYRTTTDTTPQLTSSGTLTIGPLGTGLTFPYGDGAVSAITKREFIVVPIANNQAAANSGGSITLTTTSNVATGTSTTFGSDYKVGDFIKFINTANTAQTVVRQITFITNNTSLGLNSNSSLSITANAVQFFPAMYPLALESRSDRTLTISGGSKTATINVGKTLASTVNAIVTYSVTKTNSSPVTKTINRDLYVKIHTSNNVGGANGPWALGIPGIARLKKVYLGSNTTVNTSSSDITKFFFIDTGDDENAYRGGKLTLLSNSAVTISANQYMLVQLDAFTTGGAEGFFTVGSYSMNDSANLASSTSTINILEIPETVTKKGAYYDLRDTIDFRPYGIATANLSTTVAGATINPNNAFSLSGDDQFFPVPDSTFTYDVEYYLPRRDAITVDVHSNFVYKTGVPQLSPVPPGSMPSTLVLGTITVPPYPSLFTVLNDQTMQFVSKKVGSYNGPSDARLRKYKVSSKQELGATQPRRYTMDDIGVIDRRIQALEKQVTLTAMEKAVTDITIPSAISPSLNRFKNGFFIEPFADFSRSNSKSPEFSAAIDTTLTELLPPFARVNFECMFDTTDATTANAIINNTLSLPYTPIVFIDQFVKVEPVIPITITNNVYIDRTITQNVYVDRTITQNVYITNTTVVNNTIYVPNTVIKVVTETVNVYVTNTVYNNTVLYSNNTIVAPGNTVYITVPAKPTPARYNGGMQIFPSTFSLIGQVEVLEDAPHTTVYKMGPPPTTTTASPVVVSDAVSDHRLGGYLGSAIDF